MTAVNLMVAKVELHIEIPMAFAPVPSLRADPERYERAEEQVVLAAKAAMARRALLKGPLEVTLAVTYPPGASMRKGHTWRVTAPTCWDLSRFILPLLQGKCFVSAGQVAKLTVTKTYGDKPRTVITIAELTA